VGLVFRDSGRGLGWLLYDACVLQLSFWFAVGVALPPIRCLVDNYLTRLVTRTKEFKVYASHWRSKVKGVMKVGHLVSVM